jgi:hypothetical protein
MKQDVPSSNGLITKQLYKLKVFDLFLFIKFNVHTGGVQVSWLLDMDAYYVYVYGFRMGNR